MIAALFVAAGVAILHGPSTRRRARHLWGSRRDSPRRFDASIAAAAMAPLLGWLLVGGMWGLMAGAATAPVVWGFIQRAASSAVRRRADLLRDQTPFALDLVSAALASGRPPASALAVVGSAIAAPMADELISIARRLQVSGDMASAMAGVPAPLAVLAAAMRRAEVSGAPIAQVVSSASADARRASEAARRESARQIGVRTAAPLGLCFLPAFLLIGIVPTVIAIAGTAVHM